MNASFNVFTVDRSPLLDDIILHEDDLTEESKKQFDYHTTILHLFELNRQLVVENDQITRIGRHLLLSRLENSHTICKRVLNYVASSIEMSRCSLPKFGPVIICGLPRTGSTLLYNLLACDPDCHAPLSVEMSGESIPPISRSSVDQHERRTSMTERDAQLCEALVARQSSLAAIHPSFAIEEDYQILEQAGICAPVIFSSSAHHSKLDALYYNEIYRDVAYMYHKTFLSMLNSVGKPRSHWLLKTPEHSFYLNVLLRHYPQSALIMTHRSLEDVLPSFSSLTWAFDNIYYDKADKTKQELSKAQAVRYIDKMVEHIMEFRLARTDSHHQVDESIFDVVYDDLIQQPIAIVRRIYDHFGLPWSQKFETAMCAWLHDNPQGKQGRHAYNLSELDLTREDIDRRYAAYTNLFLRSSNLSEFSSNVKSCEEIL